MRIASDLRFAIIPEWLLDHPDLTPIALRVFAVMARYADKDTDQACRSRSTLARRACCSPDTLDRALRLLRDLGAVEWDRQTDERGNAPSAYLVHFAPPPSRVDAANPSRVDAATPTREQRDKEKKNLRAAALTEVLCNQPGCGIPAPCWNHFPEAWGPSWRIGRRDALWEALVAAIGEGPTTKGENGRWGEAVAQLRAAGATPIQIGARVFEYRRRWPKIELTPTAVSNNWTTLGRPRRGSVTGMLDALDSIGGAG